MNPWPPPPTTPYIPTTPRLLRMSQTCSPIKVGCMFMHLRIQLQNSIGSRRMCLVGCFQGQISVCVPWCFYLNVFLPNNFNRPILTWRALLLPVSPRYLDRSQNFSFSSKSNYALLAQSKVERDSLKKVCKIPSLFNYVVLGGTWGPSPPFQLQCFFHGTHMQRIGSHRGIGSKADLKREVMVFPKPGAAW